MSKGQISRLQGAVRGSSKGIILGLILGFFTGGAYVDSNRFPILFSPEGAFLGMIVGGSVGLIVGSYVGAKRVNARQGVFMGAVTGAIASLIAGLAYSVWVSLYGFAAPVHDLPEFLFVFVFNLQIIFIPSVIFGSLVGASVSVIAWESFSLTYGAIMGASLGSFIIANGGPFFTAIIGAIAAFARWPVPRTQEKQPETNTEDVQ